MTILQGFELAYYIFFIILTILIVFYTAKNYQNTVKNPMLLVRMNYNFDGVCHVEGCGTPVTIDVLNIGDRPMTKVTILFNSGTLGSSINETIEFIGPHEMYKYAVGFIKDGRINWISPNERYYTPLDVASDPTLFTISVKESGHIINVDFSGEKQC